MPCEKLDIPSYALTAYGERKLTRQDVDRRFGMSSVQSPRYPFHEADAGQRYFDEMKKASSPDIYQQAMDLIYGEVMRVGDEAQRKVGKSAVLGMGYKHDHICAVDTADPNATPEWFAVQSQPAAPAASRQYLEYCAALEKQINDTFAMTSDWFTIGAAHGTTGLGPVASGVGPGWGIGTPAVLPPQAPVPRPKPALPQAPAPPMPTQAQFQSAQPQWAVVPPDPVPVPAASPMNPGWDATQPAPRHEEDDTTYERSDERYCIPFVQHLFMVEPDLERFVMRRVTAHRYQVITLGYRMPDTTRDTMEKFLASPNVVIEYRSQFRDA